MDDECGIGDEVSNVTKESGKTVRKKRKSTSLNKVKIRGKKGNKVKKKMRTYFSTS